ncbi:DUF2304 domain-containing protein [Methanobrevibacter sp.]|uniref:DUF2304 domain-containing protein n=1 Tax=Methanobrevibacter sp. TaxID=66852 RepID=UPI003868FCA2
MFFILGSLHLYQILLVLIAIFTLIFAYQRLRNKKSTPAAFVLWIVIWIFLLLFAFKPDITIPLADLFGFGRGIDLLLIIGVLLSLYLGFRLYIKFDDMNQHINDLVRELAIRNEIELDEEE